MGINKQLFMDIREEEYFRDKMYFETQDNILFRELINENHEYREEYEYNKSSTKQSGVEENEKR